MRNNLIGISGGPETTDTRPKLQTLATEMKRFLIALGLIGALCGTARAQNYPWCLQSGAFLGAVHCTYPSFEQCQFDRQGLGGFCSQNPEYAPSQHGIAKGRQR
jgi:hypothetical protein